jgi:sulfur carrier protein
MNVIVSGVERRFNDDINIALLLKADAIDARGIAVAVNECVVRKSEWEKHQLLDGDRVEIVRAVQGG